MDNDDRQIGRILSRREVLRLFGATSAGLLVGCAPGTSTSSSSTAVPATAASTATPNAEGQTAVAIAEDPTAQATQAAEVATADAASVPACVVQPEVTEGPYYVEEDLVRSDIRSDSTTGEMRPGTPFQLTFQVSEVTSSTCAALAGATVEIWHCDADGAYSDVSDPGFDTTGQDWLRGAQVTDANGLATFTTIYPGWYSSRAVHIHFKIHPDENSVFTSQLFFDDTLSDQVFTNEPYSAKGQRDTLNSTDSIYQDSLLLTVTQTSDGYAATFPIGIDPSTLGSGSSSGGGAPGGNPPSGGPARSTATSN